MLAFGACSAISNSGPSANDIVQQAGPPSAPSYEFVDIDPSVVELLRQQSLDSFQSRFGDYRPAIEPRIGIGDPVLVTVWEASAGGLSGSKPVTIPDQVVGRDGTIFIPYAGRIRVAGHTTREVERIIQHALEAKANQPQVLINVTRAVSNTVTVTGEVVNGALVPLSAKGERIMDVIAMAGGFHAPVNETYVQLSRGPSTVRVPLKRVATDPSENIYVRPNDVLTLIRDPQTFIAYGATGRNAEIPFDAEGMTLSQALANAGGLLDSRSDPAGVFIFRYEPENIARLLRPDSHAIQPGRLTPIVFRLNMNNPNSLFAAQNFGMANRDFLYVSNAPITDFEKALGIFNSVLAPSVSAASVCLDIKC